MNKTVTIALREYRAAVRSKAFVITLVVMPILMGGAIVGQLLLRDRVDTTDKVIAVVDGTGQLAPELEKRVADYNDNVAFEGEGASRKKVKPKFIIEQVTPNRSGWPETALDLSERVRKKELHGFLMVDADIISGKGENTVAYHSQNPVDTTFRRWVEPVINAKVQQIRCGPAEIDPQALNQVTRHVRVADRKLVKRNEKTGKIEPPEESNVMAHIFLPMGLMMLVFMSVMVGATPLMQAVMEEKQARISEVLLGSVGPFQLMLGKLTGIVAVTLTTVMLYIAGAFVTLKYLGHGDLFPSTDVVIWLVVFQTLAVLMYGALFIAIGAAVTDMREAQSAMMPVMIFAMAPMFVWLYVVREPTSTVAVALSLFPPATPMLMLLRVAVEPGAPLWQALLGCGLVVLFTIFCVYAAARIFRVGILMQGKGASYRQMLRWVFRS